MTLAWDCPFKDFVTCVNIYLANLIYLNLQPLEVVYYQANVPGLPYVIEVYVSIRFYSVSRDGRFRPY